MLSWKNLALSNINYLLIRDPQKSGGNVHGMMWIFYGKSVLKGKPLETQSKWNNIKWKHFRMQLYAVYASKVTVYYDKFVRSIWASNNTWKWDKNLCFQISLMTYEETELIEMTLQFHSIHFDCLNRFAEKKKICSMRSSANKQSFENTAFKNRSSWWSWKNCKQLDLTVFLQHRMHPMNEYSSIDS